MKTFVATAAAVAVLIAGQAAAQPGAEPLSQRVSYADLDLSSATGRAALERRIKQAVSRVCPGKPHIAQLKENNIHRACLDTAWSGARQQMAAIYDGRAFAQASIEVRGAR